MLGGGGGKHGAVEVIDKSNNKFVVIYMFEDRNGANPSF